MARYGSWSMAPGGAASRASCRGPLIFPGRSCSSSRTVAAARYLNPKAPFVALCGGAGCWALAERLRNLATSSDASSRCSPGGEHRPRAHRGTSWHRSFGQGRERSRSAFIEAHVLRRRERPGPAAFRCSACAVTCQPREEVFCDPRLATRSRSLVPSQSLCRSLRPARRADAAQQGVRSAGDVGFSTADSQKPFSSRISQRADIDEALASRTSARSAASPGCAPVRRRGWPTRAPSETVSGRGD